MKLILTYLLFLCLPVLTGNQYVHASSPAKKHTLKHENHRQRHSVESLSPLNVEDLPELSLFSDDDNDDDEFTSTKKKSFQSLSSSLLVYALPPGLLSNFIYFN